jgi:predicted RNase H-like nuclease
MLTTNAALTLIGVDACSGGWICVAKERGRFQAWIAPKFADVLANRVPQSVLVGIDIPIGLPGRGSRECDREARAILGWPRRCSVFSTPVRPTLVAKDYGEACAIHRSIDGRALSKQAFNLLPKISEVDECLRADASLASRVREVHPEISFALWNGRTAMRHGKKTAAGSLERASLIDASWPKLRRQLVAQLPRAGYASDDLLDAIAALWSMCRAAKSRATRLPAIVVYDEFGLPMQVVA